MALFTRACLLNGLLCLLRSNLLFSINLRYRESTGAWDVFLALILHDCYHKRVNSDREAVVWTPRQQVRLAESYDHCNSTFRRLYSRMGVYRDSWTLHCIVNSLWVSDVRLDGH